ncbi:MAG TPA: copper transporter [Actinomycetota bacterium]|nr:copper transporter [Actinomycetota bacterium]
MISFRYHLVSIVSVFLALALGVLVGTTVVNQGVIDDLNNRTNSAVKRAKDLETQVGDLQGQVKEWSGFATAVEPLLVEGQLTGTEVVLVTQEGVDPADLERVRRALENAGGKVVAELVITKRMALTDEAARVELAELVGSFQSTDPVGLAEAAAQRLASRLTAGPGSPDADLIDRLRTAGFLVMRGGGTPEDIGATFQSVVLLAGGSDARVVDPARFLQPLATSLVESSRPLVAAETTQTAMPFVALIRNDGALDGDLVTVDNADQIPGRVAIVFGLRDLLASPGQGGDYGVKDGASGILPRP